MVIGYFCSRERLRTFDGRVQSKVTKALIFQYFFRKNPMKCSIIITLLFIPYALSAHTTDDLQAIRQAVLDYIESQEQVIPKRMERSLDRELAKRTYWLNAEGEEFIMHSDYETMLKIAASYNKKGDKFGPNPKKHIEVFDIDQRVASVKLTVDDWIDYMHLYKNQQGQWKVINVLWQFHDTSQQKSRQ